MTLFEFPPATDAGFPASLSTAPDDIRHALSTKEGWRTFVDERPVKPQQVTMAALERMSSGERATYNNARFAFHRSLVIVRHDQLNTAWERMRDIVVGQHADDGPGVGIALTGGPGFGKTAISAGFLRVYERSLRESYPAAFTQENEFIPVAYSSLLSGAGLKSQMQHILRFYGMPMPRSATGAQLADELIRVMNVCRTRVLCLDQAQNLHTGNRKDEEVAAYLKEIMDGAHMTLILTGINIHEVGPLALQVGGRSDRSNDRLQLARRFGVVRIRPLQAGSPEWLTLLATIEQQLILSKARPGDLSQGLADAIWELSRGAIGVTFNVLHLAANRAIATGTERITRHILRGVARTIEAERLARDSDPV
jgi:hypothetical protein